MFEQAYGFENSVAFAGKVNGMGIDRHGLKAQTTHSQSYRLMPGKALIFTVKEGDQLTFQDLDGYQGTIVIAALDEKHAAATSKLQGVGTQEATEKQCFGFFDPVFQTQLSNLKTRPQDWDLKCLPLGEPRSCIADKDLLVFATNPIATTDPNRILDTGAIGIDVQASQAAKGNGEERLLMPDPLFDPKMDKRLKASTGTAYEVKKGDYIQILDIEGRQCSDFIAFPKSALDKGLERFIDSTASRTMVRGAYPMPGLTDKFYDQDLIPLLRVVQDTCGRHDTFGLACTSRGYSMRGYEEHPNCSDNITNCIKPYGVSARKAWPAINFFFNTQVLDGNAVAHAPSIQGDEGWSRPGDYVLMQAMTDLVCVSTSCADDTSPINGWAPSDIQLRVYDEKAAFRRQVAFRTTPDSTALMTQETGFHPRTSALTRDFRALKDKWIPGSFTNGGTQAEYEACCTKATIQDLSQLRKIDIHGPDAQALMDYVLPRDVSKQAAGQVLYSPILRDNGTLFDDGTLFRLSPTGFRWMGADNRTQEWLQTLADRKGFSATVRDVSDLIHNVAVQGPLSTQIVKKIAYTGEHQPYLDELKRFRFSLSRLLTYEGPGITISRSGYTGLLGYEIFCAPKDATALWDALMDAGDGQLAPMGLDALDMLRIEARLPAGGQEFNEDINPFELGLGFTTNLKKKTADFVGRAALETMQHAPRYKAVQLVVDGQIAPDVGAHLFVGLATVGHITSTVYSPKHQGLIALARLTDLNINQESELEVGLLDQHMKRTKARILQF